KGARIVEGDGGCPRRKRVDLEPLEARNLGQPPADLLPLLETGKLHHRRYQTPWLSFLRDCLGRHSLFVSHRRHLIWRSPRGLPAVLQNGIGEGRGLLRSDLGRRAAKFVAPSVVDAADAVGSGKPGDELAAIGGLPKGEYQGRAAIVALHRGKGARVSGQYRPDHPSLKSWPRLQDIGRGEPMGEV